MSRTGQGTTIAMADSGFTALMHFIGGTEEQRGEVETSHLGLAVGARRTFAPGDLLESVGFDARFEWSPSGAQPPLDGDPEPITLTFALRSGQVVPATVSGTGFVRRRKGADLEVNKNEVMLGEYSVRWDGLTGPVYTPAAAGLLGEDGGLLLAEDGSLLIAE